MGGLVEDQIAKAMNALREVDPEAARNVVARDHVVNFLDVQADEQIGDLLAFRQPVGKMEAARNVGHIINVTFIVKSLERIDDHSRNIAEYGVFLVKGKDVRHVSAEPIDTEELDR